MQIGLVGLGKMGLSLAKNLVDHGHQVVAYDLKQPELEGEYQANIKLTQSVEAMVEALPELKIVWSMVPCGEPTDQIIEKMQALLPSGSILIDGGNSNYKESVARGERLASQGIHFFDVGTSGGVEGARQGACFMIGGDATVFQQIEPLFQDMAVEKGYLYAGPVGSGHYLKMVHNGIEYGMMQAIAEGFDVLEHGPFNYDYEQVARVWNNGSVIRSWLMELTESAFSKDEHLDEIQGKMFSSGEGKWTVEESLATQVPTPVITMALMMRYRSMYPDTFSGKVVAALRNEFGGHAVAKSDKN